MRRSLLVGGAWIVATGMSVLVAYAAVGEVRDRVVDQPQPLSVVLSTTASPSTSSPGDASSSTSIAVPSSTAPIDPTATSTTAPSVSGVTSESTAAPNTTTGSSTSTTAVSADSEIKTYSTAGGTVSIEVFPDHLVLLGAVPTPGYSVAEQEISPTQMEIEFKSGEHEIHFKARLNGDGSVAVAIESGEEHDD